MLFMTPEVLLLSLLFPLQGEKPLNAWLLWALSIKTRPN